MSLPALVLAVLAASSGPRPSCYLDVRAIPPQGTQGRVWLEAVPTGCDIHQPVLWSSSDHHAIVIGVSPKGVAYVMGLNGIYTITARAGDVSGTAVLVLADADPLQPGGDERQFHER